MKTEKMRVCKDCGKEISKNAKVCPNCGRRKKKSYCSNYWYFCSFDSSSDDVR